MKKVKGRPKGSREDIKCKTCKHFVVKYAPYARGLIEVCDLEHPETDCLKAYLKFYERKEDAHKDKKDTYEEGMEKMLKERLATNESIQVMDSKE